MIFYVFKYIKSDSDTELVYDVSAKEFKSSKEAYADFCRLQGLDIFQNAELCALVSREKNEILWSPYMNTEDMVFTMITMTENGYDSEDAKHYYQQEK